MGTLRFFKTYLILTLGRLRRQLWLLAGLALLCLLLSIGAGRAAEQLLSQGVGLEGVTLAVAAPEGDKTPQQLEQYMNGMEDVAQYCHIVAMEEGQALAALGRGEVTAVLLLPENFIQGVRYGENPDLRLVVAGDRPLESLLLLWVGQSASDMLSAFQGGVYAVLELYEKNPPEGLDWDQVMVDINLRYITMALNRSNSFQIQMVSATRALPIPLHYALSLLAYFALSAAPLFMPVYSGGWLRFQRRLRGVGRGCAVGFAAGWAAGVPALLVLLAPALLAAGAGRRPLALLGAAVGMAVFCSLFCSLCCLTAGSAAGCGVLAFLSSLAALALAGGIVPPVLLPPTLQRLGWLSPVTWLRQLAAWPMGYEAPPASTWACLALCTLGMAALAWALYRREVDRQEVER